MLLKPILAAILAIGIAGQPARAQSAAELLQKGIYTQDTVGDLDGAIRIYRQVLNASADSRAVAAQAQYRLGLCLLSKGDSAGATQAFQKLIKDYPDQRDLVSKAHQKLPRLSLIPVPWPDHEWAEYRIVVNGVESPGTIVYSIEPSPNSATHIILVARNTVAPAWYKAEVDRESMTPISTWQRMGAMVVSTDYRDGDVVMSNPGKQPRKIAVDNGAYDGQSAPFVVRRLALEENYKVSFPILSEVGTTMPLEAKVKAQEDVQVPAGKFHCFKVAVDVSPAGVQTFWYATDASHTMVKFSIGTVDVELTRINSTGPEPTNYIAQNAPSFIAPAGWIVDKPHPFGDGMQINLSDPEGQAGVGHVFYMQEKIQPSEIDAFLRQKPALKERKRDEVDWKNYKIRRESVQRFQLKGYEALRMIADYINKENLPKVEWMTFVRTENTRMTISGEGIDPGDLDSFVTRFRPIVDSLVVP
jgi:hypothetical protein